MRPLFCTLLCLISIPCLALSEPEYQNTYQEKISHHIRHNILRFTTQTIYGGQCVFYGKYDNPGSRPKSNCTDYGMVINYLAGGPIPYGGKLIDKPIRDPYNEKITKEKYRHFRDYRIESIDPKKISVWDKRMMAFGEKYKKPSEWTADEKFNNRYIYCRYWYSSSEPNHYVPETLGKYTGYHTNAVFEDIRPYQKAGFWDYSDGTGTRDMISINRNGKLLTAFPEHSTAHPELFPMKYRIWAGAAEDPAMPYLGIVDDDLPYDFTRENPFAKAEPINKESPFLYVYDFDIFRNRSVDWRLHDRLAFGYTSNFEEDRHYKQYHKSGDRRNPARITYGPVYDDINHPVLRAIRVHIFTRMYYAKNRLVKLLHPAPVWRNNRYHYHDQKMRKLLNVTVFPEKYYRYWQARPIESTSFLSRKNVVVPKYDSTSNCRLLVSDTRSHVVRLKQQLLGNFDKYADIDRYPDYDRVRERYEKEIAKTVPYKYWEGVQRFYINYQDILKQYRDYINGTDRKVTKRQLMQQFRYIELFETYKDMYQLISFSTPLRSIDTLLIDKNRYKKTHGVALWSGCSNTGELRHSFTIGMKRIFPYFESRNYMTEEIDYEYCSMRPNYLAVTVSMDDSEIASKRWAGAAKAYTLAPSKRYGNMNKHIKTKREIDTRIGFGSSQGIRIPITSKDSGLIYAGHLTDEESRQYIRWYRQAVLHETLPTPEEKKARMQWKAPLEFTNPKEAIARMYERYGNGKRRYGKKRKQVQRQIQQQNHPRVINEDEIIQKELLQGPFMIVSSRTLAKYGKAYFEKMAGHALKIVDVTGAITECNARTVVECDIDYLKQMMDLPYLKVFAKETDTIGISMGTLPVQRSWNADEISRAKTYKRKIERKITPRLSMFRPIASSHYDPLGLKKFRFDATYRRIAQEIQAAYKQDRKQNKNWQMLRIHGNQSFDKFVPPDQDLEPMKTVKEKKWVYNSSHKEYRYYLNDKKVPARAKPNQAWRVDREMKYFPVAHGAWVIDRMVRLAKEGRLPGSPGTNHYRKYIAKYFPQFVGSPRLFATYFKYRKKLYRALVFPRFKYRKSGSSLVYDGCADYRIFDVSTAAESAKLMAPVLKGFDRHYVENITKLATFGNHVWAAITSRRQYFEMQKDDYVYEAEKYVSREYGYALRKKHYKMVGSHIGGTDITSPSPIRWDALTADTTALCIPSSYGAYRMTLVYNKINEDWRDVEYRNKVMLRKGNMGDYYESDLSQSKYHGMYYPRFNFYHVWNHKYDYRFTMFPNIVWIDKVAPPLDGIRNLMDARGAKYSRTEDGLDRLKMFPGMVRHIHGDWIDQYLRYNMEYMPNRKFEGWTFYIGHQVPIGVEFADDMYLTYLYMLKKTGTKIKKPAHERAWSFVSYLQKERALPVDGAEFVVTNGIPTPTLRTKHREFGISRPKGDMVLR